MAGTNSEWADRTARHLKAELKRAGVGYAELAERLTNMGIAETDTSVAAKVNRGVFPAWFLFAVMQAIGATSLHLGDWS